MTPAKLQAVADMDAYAHSLADKGTGTPSERPSENPAADLAFLASL